jgi:hypothetical protein
MATATTMYRETRLEQARVELRHVGHPQLSGVGQLHSRTL